MSNFVAEFSQGDRKVQKRTLRYKFVLHYVLHSNLEMCYTFIVASDYPPKADDATKNFKWDEKEIGWCRLWQKKNRGN